MRTSGRSCRHTGGDFHKAVPGNDGAIAKLTVSVVADRPQAPVGTYEKVVAVTSADRHDPARRQNWNHGQGGGSRVGTAGSVCDHRHIASRIGDLRVGDRQGCTRRAADSSAIGEAHSVLLPLVGECGSTAGGDFECCGGAHENDLTRRLAGYDGITTWRQRSNVRRDTAIVVADYHRIVAGIGCLE